MTGSITDVPGVHLGHSTHALDGTGCTVVLVPEGASAGVDVRGAFPGTSETPILGPAAASVPVHAILLAGGSDLGLEASSGVMRFLEEQGLGLETGRVRVPRVPAAVVFDLGVGRADARPTAEDGYRACSEAGVSDVERGSVGAGTGAVVAKLLGMSRGVKGGFGTASVRLDSGVTVGAAVVANAVGGVYDFPTGRLVAGPLAADGRGFVDPLQAVLSPGYRPPAWLEGANTVIGAVATDATVDRVGASRLASVAHDGLALAVRPAHTVFDGDTFFALATCRSRAAVPFVTLGAAVAVAVANAVVDAVESATTLHDVQAIRDLEAQ